MEHDGSLPYSQELATCPHSETHESSFRAPIIFLRSILLLSSPLRLDLPRTCCSQKQNIILKLESALYLTAVFIFLNIIKSSIC
jgi:hypothetical protein